MDLFGFVLGIVGLAWSIILLVRVKKSAWWSWVAGVICGTGGGLVLAGIWVYLILHAIR